MKRKYTVILIGNALTLFVLFALSFKATLNVYNEYITYMFSGCTQNMEYLQELQGLYVFGCLITIIFLLGTVSNVFMLVNMFDKEEIK